MKVNKYFISIFVVLSLLVGGVYSSPHIFRAYELHQKGERYIPVTKQADFDIMNVHAARYRELVDGHFFAGEIDSYEHKDGPAIWPLLSSDILAPFLLFAKTIFPMFYISDFLFPIFTFVTFYWLFCTVTKNKWYSLVASFFVVMFPQFSLLFPPSSLGELKNILYQLSPIPIEGHWVSNLTYLRREAFLPGAPFFILAWYFLYRAFFEETKKKNSVLAGIFLGLLFYFYLYYWLFAFTVLGLYFFVLLIQKEKQQLVTLIKIGVVALLVSIPFWISHVELSHLANYQELTLRAGVEYGRSFRFGLWKSYVVNIVLGMVILFFSAKTKQQRQGIFLSLLSFAQIAVLNLQVLSGFNIQSDHWSGRVFVSINAIILTAALWYAYSFFYEQWKENRLVLKYKTPVIIVLLHLIFFVMLNNIFTQYVVAQTTASLYTVQPDLMSAYEWLSQNTPVDSVVLSPDLETNIDITAFAPNRIFLARSQTSIASEEELLDRLYRTYSFFHLPAAQLKNMIQSHGGIVYFFTSKYEAHTLDSHLSPEKYGDLDLPPEVLDRIIKGYQNFSSESAFGKYKVDYIFVGLKEQSLGINEKVLEPYPLVYKNNSVRIYLFSQ